MNWQPIETAPKDGTWILVNDGTGSAHPPVHVVHWSNPEWMGGPDTWVTMAIGPNPDTYEPNPTHWMPIPTPPSD